MGLLAHLVGGLNFPADQLLLTPPGNQQFLPLLAQVCKLLSAASQLVPGGVDFPADAADCFFGAPQRVAE